MATSNKMQVALGQDNSITVSNDQQPPVTSARNTLLTVYSSDYRLVLH